MREILKDFLREFFTLLYAAWTAQADQASEAMWSLAALLLQMLLMYLTLRWVWRKLK